MGNRPASRTTFREHETEGRGYYVVKAEAVTGLTREWWLSYYGDNDWQCSEFTNFPSRHGPADDFRGDYGR